MPGRDHSFQTGSYYHVYNKTIDGKRPLETTQMIMKIRSTSWYYRSAGGILRFADFAKLPKDKMKHYREIIDDERHMRVKIFAYCFMPTHYHFLIQQRAEGGISEYISLIQNSFTRYYNSLNYRKGPLFLHRFSSRPLESEEDMKHLARYIHLNPYTSGLARTLDMTFRYPGSSFTELQHVVDSPISDKQALLKYFQDDIELYRHFVSEHAEAQHD